MTTHKKIQDTGPVGVQSGNRFVNSNNCLQINQELHERIADLEAAVESRDQQIDELCSELSDVSRSEAVEAAEDADLSLQRTCANSRWRSGG